MPKPSDNLTDLHSRFLEQQGAEWCQQCRSVCRKRQATLASLRKRRIVTVSDLAARFSELPSRLKQRALDLILILRIRQMIPVLQANLPDVSVRLMCAHVLGTLGLTRRGIRLFLEIGQRELRASHPDPEWLQAAVWALGMSSDRLATELLVAIFERRDLPGNLRGDAGDKLGTCRFDRRTNVYRRCRDAALCGLTDDCIEVQFWSMYVIASLCNIAGTRQRVDKSFRAALPRLRKIAAHHHRHAPGVWWPLSAEAEDAIGSIENGIWPEPDAADRWPVKRDG